MAKYEIENGIGYIPNSETIISKGAFKNCEELTSIILPGAVWEIGEEAFMGCTYLTKIVILASVVKIGWGAFANCYNLTSITVLFGNNYFDSRDNCNAIIDKRDKALIVGCKNTVIPSTVKEIKGEAFKGCSGLTRIRIPDSVEKIGWGAFSD